MFCACSARVLRVFCACSARVLRVFCALRTYGGPRRRGDGLSVLDIAFKYEMSKRTALTHSARRQSWWGAGRRVEGEGCALGAGEWAQYCFHIAKLAGVTIECIYAWAHTFAFWMAPNPKHTTIGFLYT